MTLTRSIAVLLLFAASAPAPARAQILSEQLQDNQRVCTYAGTDTLPDGQVVPRTFVVGLGQDCPATAPYRDPNAAVPPNAALLGERTGAGARVCVYGEGGIEYQVPIAVTLRCAMTPALLEQEQAAGVQEQP